MHEEAENAARAVEAVLNRIYSLAYAADRDPTIWESPTAQESVRAIRERAQEGLDEVAELRAALRRDDDLDVAA